MLILGIETATTRVGCAIADGDGVLASAHSTRARRHAESLTPALDHVRRAAGVELRELAVVAVDVGPGLFTGLRVGVATGKALAFALDVPMVGISSLDLLAFAARLSSRRIAAVIDARRGEVFFARYRRSRDGVERLGQPRVAAPGELAAQLAASQEEHLLVGDGALRYADQLCAGHRVEVADRGFAHPDARSLVQLARAKAARGELVASRDLEPMYLRLPDADINWSTREVAGGQLP